MFRVELYGAVRRAVTVDGLSHREAARRFGVHRNTISKMLQYSAPPGYRRRERPVSPKLGPHIAWIDAVLESDRGVHAKQRHTAQRLFDRLRAEEGYTGGYTIVRGTGSNCPPHQCPDFVHVFDDRPVLVVNRADESGPHIPLDRRTAIGAPVGRQGVSQRV